MKLNKQSLSTVRMVAKQTLAIIAVIEEWVEKNPGVMPSPTAIAEQVGCTRQVAHYYIKKLIEE